MLLLDLYSLLVISAAILYLVTTKSSDMFPTSSASATISLVLDATCQDEEWSVAKTISAPGSSMKG